MFGNILVAVDGSDHGRKAVELGGIFAAKTGAALTLLHVHLQGRAAGDLERLAAGEHLVDPDADDRSPSVASIAGTAAEALLAADSRRHEHEVVSRVGDLILHAAEQTARELGARDIRTLTADGDTAKAVLDAAEKVDADLVVLGSRGLGELRGLMLGSVSLKVASQAVVPVMIAR